MALIFGALALWAFRSRKPVHFRSGSVVRPEEITDIPAYNRACGVMFALYGASFLPSCLLTLINVALGVTAFALAATAGVVPLVVAYKRIYNKYKAAPADGVEAPAPRPMAVKIAYGLGIALSLALVAGLAWLLGSGMSDPAMTVDGEGLHISGVYGLTVPLGNITEVTLIEQSIRQIGGLGSRVNGVGGIGDVLKGHFSGSLGNTLVFLRADSSPTLRVERADGGDIYISFANGEKTRALHGELAAALGR
jgi:hypothetical protein